MRAASLGVVLALAAITVFTPAQVPPSPGPSESHASPPVAVCSLEEGSGRSGTATIVSTVDGEGRLTAFAGGSTAGAADFRTGESGSVAIDVLDVAAVGVVGGLVEMPGPASAATSMTRGASSLAAEVCAAAPVPQAVLGGGSTAAGSRFEVHLMNPYAGDAIASLTLVTEAGVEGGDRFSAMVIPSRGSTVIDLSEAFPGRESFAVTVDTVAGNVVAVGRQSIEGDSAMWRAVEAAQDWFVPVGARGPARLLLVSPINADIEYQIDLYGPEGYEEAYAVGTLEARSQVWLDLDEFAGEEIALRVISGAPIVPTLWIVGEGVLAATPGTTEGGAWFLPGAGSVDGSETIVLLNSGIEPSTFTVTPLGANARPRTYELGGEEIIEIELRPAEGYLISSTGPSSVLWIAARGDAISLSTGVRVDEE